MSKKQPKKRQKKEKTFHVHAVATVSLIKTITAFSKEEAEAKAKDLSTPRLCHECSSKGSETDDQWEINGGDIDVMDGEDFFIEEF